MELIKKLNKIQQELKAPKNQYNNFGKYTYRSCEDILEAVKPLLEGIVLTINDELVNIGNRYYVKATAKFDDGQNCIENTAYAREPESKKGMDESQITGTASSYARKYALNGLFLIDDSKDADSNEHASQTTQSRTASRQNPPATSKATLFNFIKTATGTSQPTDEQILEVISKHTGVNINNKSELTEVKCKNLVELWA